MAETSDSQFTLTIQGARAERDVPTTDFLLVRLI
jgi:hypothetical protein